MTSPIFGIGSKIIPAVASYSRRENSCISSRGKRKASLRKVCPGWARDYFWWRTMARVCSNLCRSVFRIIGRYRSFLRYPPQRMPKHCLPVSVSQIRLTVLFAPSRIKRYAKNAPALILRRNSGARRFLSCNRSPGGKTFAGCRFGLEHHLLRDKRVQAALSHIYQARWTDMRNSHSQATFESALMQDS